MSLLNFSETKKLLLKYKIPFCKTEFVTSKEEAINFAKKIGFPVVLKIFSKEILHKTDIGGVKTEIKNEKELKKSFNELKKIKKIEGILIQKQIKGQEIAIGMKRDNQFGPVLMVGLGGIFIEVLKDISFRICPLSKKEAKEMIKELKGYPILKGYRNQKPVNLEKISEIITNLSKLSLKEKNIKEIDLKLQ